MSLENIFAAKNFLKLQPENVRKSLWQWIQNEMKKSRNQKKKHAHEIQSLAQKRDIGYIDRHLGSLFLRGSKKSLMVVSYFPKENGKCS